MGVARCVQTHAHVGLGMHVWVHTGPRFSCWREVEKREEDAVCTAEKQREAENHTAQKKQRTAHSMFYKLCLFSMGDTFLGVDKSSRITVQHGCKNGCRRVNWFTP